MTAARSALRTVLKSIVIAVTAMGLGFGVALPASASDETSRWYERIDFAGDFRARSEAFVIAEVPDRHRLRYRLRLGAKTALSDHFDLGFRLATGAGANTGNQTLGSGVDFDPDGVFIDRAYLTFTPHGSEKPVFGDSLAVTFGKMPNPFRPKGMGPAVLIWDGDQMPEGVALAWSATPAEFWATNLDVAYFVIDENGSARDPGIFAVQLDNDLEVIDQLHFKSQLSYYALRKLNADFFERGTGIVIVGNPPAPKNLTFGGNTAGVSGNNKIDLLEFQGAISWTGCEDWPLTLWGNVIFNTSAINVGQGRRDTGFGFGFEAGSKTAVAKLGLGYFKIEANAVPSTLGDSDVFDGITNGKGFQTFVVRRLWKNIDFDLHAYFGEKIKTNPSQTRTPNKRIRIQTNIIVTF